MTVELYEAPVSDSSAAMNSPISNITGELPDQEPELDPGSLLGSFDSREEAISFVQNQLSTNGQRVADSQVVPFSEYTHIELLTISIQNEDQSTHQASYYLVTDEGY